MDRTNVVDQQWFIDAVNPTAEEKLFIGEHCVKFAEKCNTLIKDGMDGQAAMIQVAKEMLGKS